MADATEPVVDDPTKANEVEADAGEVAAGAVNDDAADAGTQVGDDKPKAGTPDKALQKLQQELGIVTRQLAALTEKKAEQGTLSEADKAKAAKMQERLARIREYADDPIAEQVLDINDRLGEQDKLKTELADAKARLAAMEHYVGWERARAKYTGLDVDAIWDKALKDAGETLANDATPAATSRLASRWFEERCDAALKRKKDGGEKPPANNRTSPPSTYKVGSGEKPPPTLSEEDEVLAEARSLVKEI